MQSSSTRAAIRRHQTMMRHRRRVQGGQLVVERDQANRKSIYEHNQRIRNAGVAGKGQELGECIAQIPMDDFLQLIKQRPDLIRTEKAEDRDRYMHLLIANNPQWQVQNGARVGRKHTTPDPRIQVR